MAEGHRSHKLNKEVRPHRTRGEGCSIAIPTKELWSSSASRAAGKTKTLHA